MRIWFYLAVLTTMTFSALTLAGQTKIEMKPGAARQAAGGARYACLPPDVELNTIVGTRTIKSRVGIRVLKETVDQRLKKIGARCSSGKLLDRKGRGVHFHQLQGCWGNPPADYLHILESEKQELLELKKKFTVIELTCSPTGMMPF